MENDPSRFMSLGICMCNCEGPSIVLHHLRQAQKNNEQQMSHLPTIFLTSKQHPYKIQKRKEPFFRLEHGIVSFTLIFDPGWYFLPFPSPAIPGSPEMSHSEVRLRWPVATTKMDQAGDKSYLNSPDPRWDRFLKLVSTGDYDYTF